MVWLYRADLAYNVSCIAVVHSSPDNSTAELMTSVKQSCETADVVVVDDVSLSSLHAAQLSHYR